MGSLLMKALRDAMGRSQVKCRLWVIAPRVTYVEYTSRRGKGKGKGRKLKRRLSCEGLSTCKSANCPLCVRQWERIRTAEIQSVVANWLRKDLPVVFASLTMRHDPWMPLALEMRLLGAAYGNLWSGNKGKKFAAALGAKPESIRAHDLTWSEEEWWHPHLHSLMLFAGELPLSLDEIEALFRHRWLEALPATLRSMKKAVKRLLGDKRLTLGAGPCSVHKRFMQHVARRGARCWHGAALHRRIAKRKRIEAPESWPAIEEHHQCSDCAFELGLKVGEAVPAPAPGDRVLHEEWIQETCSACMFRTGECPTNRERAQRIFGKSLVPDHMPLREIMLNLQKMLKPFTETNILPEFDRGVVLDQIHKGDPFDQVCGYLPKLGAIGFELASSSTKLGWEDEKKRRHFTKWEVAQLTTMRSEGDLRNAAFRAWKQMYKATKGLAMISFSDRKKLGLGPDCYENGNEPPEVDIDEDETKRVLGHTEKAVWVGMAREHGHELVGAVVVAHRKGVLEQMPWVDPPMGGDEPTSVLDPSERAPPEVSEGLDAAQAAAARARWRAVQARITYDAAKVDKERRFETLRAVADIAGPEAWRELKEGLARADRYLGSGLLRGADEWQAANEAHERREARRQAQGERCDMVTRAMDQLDQEGATKRSGAPRRRLIAQIEVARTLRRTGVDRITADRLAREMDVEGVTDEWLDARRREAVAALDPS